LINGQFTASGGWSGVHHVREVADVTGDGRADIVGFAHPLVVVYRSTVDGFVFGGYWLRNDMAYTKHEWRGADTPRMLGDVNGDGRADAIGFHWVRTYARVSDGEKFVRPTTPFAPLGTTMISALRPMHGNLCMYAHDTPGAPVVQGSCSPDAVSTVNWEIEALSDGTSFIRSPNGSCLRTQNDAETEGTQVVLGACDDAPAARWRIGREPDGQSLVQPAFSDRLCLGVPDASPNQGTILQVRYCDYYPNEMWRLETLHPKVMTGKIRRPGGSTQYGWLAFLPEQALDFIDSAKGWHTIVDPQTGLCATSAYSTSPIWGGGTSHTATLSFSPCIGSAAQRFVLEGVADQPNRFRMQVPQNADWCFGADMHFSSASACGLEANALTLADTETITAATMRLHGVKIPGGRTVVLTIESPIDRKIFTDPAAIVLLLDRQGIQLSDETELKWFGATQEDPPAPEDDEGVILSTFVEHADGYGEESTWHSQPEWQTGDEWGDASVQVTYLNSKYRIRNAPDEINADVGVELIEVAGTLGDEDASHVGAEVGVGIGVEAGGKWGAQGQYGFTIGIKAVTIKLYVEGDEALHGIMVGATSVRDGFAAAAEGITAVGGTIVDTVHVVGTFFSDVGDVFCGFLGC
jgi:hypothetical protein